jgi:hypothetical protein
MWSYTYCCTSFVLVPFSTCLICCSVCIVLVLVWYHLYIVVVSFNPPCIIYMENFGGTTFFHILRSIFDVLVIRGFFVHLKVLNKIKEYLFLNITANVTNFWKPIQVMRHVDARGKKRPRIFYRTTIATAGYARDLAFNPHKMEVFNGIMVEKIQNKGLLRNGGGVVDQFDMSFPWHYDNRYSDGVHYGRAPAKARWRDGEIGHHYFVDLMLCHVLLNAVCND